MSARVIAVSGDVPAAMTQVYAAVRRVLAHAPRAEVRIGTPATTATVADLVAFVAFQTGLAPVKLTGDARHAPVVRARDAVIWAAEEVLGLNKSGIGRALGDRDHSTIAVALRRATARRAADPAFRMLTGRLQRRFGRTG